jgi:3-oxoacyl-[acyl-carrier-protein] synthase II
MPERVVITGVGPVSAIGIGREEFAAALAARESGVIGEPPLARIEEFRIEDYLTSQKTYLDRCSEFTLAACALALDDAGLDIANQPHWRAGLSLGTAYGCLDTLQRFTATLFDKGPRLANPLLFSHAYANTPASLASIEFNLAGYHAVFTDGPASSAMAMVAAAEAIQADRADYVLAGGADALSEPTLALATENNAAPGEGAGVIVLEAPAHAKERGAVIRGEVSGWAWNDVGAGCDATRSAESLHNLTGDTRSASESLAVIAALGELRGHQSVCVTVRDGPRALAITIRGPEPSG